ncbi:MAG: NADPH-dependent oxidoreductase [Proteobacteria bacterium]|nr:MAG: NADPH-dependent oxidoreductase [Pseudomonadota bacterium]
MKFAIISGSARSNSQSLKISKYLEKELKQTKGNSTYLLNLEGNPIPLWDEGIFGPDEKWQKAWGPISAELESSDALVLVCPEWHGSTPAAVHNLLQVGTTKEFGHKPVLIVTVSAYVGGAYPVSELRMAGYKNNRLCYMPEQLIVRHAPQTFNGDTMESQDDAYLRARATYCLKLLAEYSKALKAVRESGVIDHKTYPNGM